MKNLPILIVLMGILAFSSCGGKAPKADLNSEIDTLSYSFGVANTEGLKDYLTNNLEIDTTYMDEFIKGVIDGSGEKSPKKNAYLAGLQIGKQLSSQIFDRMNDMVFMGDTTQTLTKDAFIAGFIAGSIDKDLKISQDEAKDMIETKMQAIQEKSMEKNFGSNKAAGIAFLETNKGKEGVVTTASGLQYKIIKEGKGPKPTADAKVKVHYHGTLIDGTVFDSSVDRKEPVTFPVTGVIKGWTEALQLMPVGSKWILYVPQELAYGTQDMGKIKPFSTLIFEVELLGIEK
jgi:FKBP-type peptidyl-prolyl cis-trans isomerase FklB